MMSSKLSYIVIKPKATEDDAAALPYDIRVIEIDDDSMINHVLVRCATIAMIGQIDI